MDAHSQNHMAFFKTEVYTQIHNEIAVTKLKLTEAAAGGFL